MYDETENLFEALGDKTFDQMSMLVRGRKFILGYKQIRAPVNRDEDHKWFVPKYLYHSNYFPDFTGGVGYVMTIATAVDLLKASLDIPHLFLEDVFLTGFCGEKAYIRRYDTRFIAPLLFENICHMKATLISHGVNEMLMRKTFKFMMSSRTDCKISADDVLDYYGSMDV